MLCNSCKTPHLIVDFQHLNYVHLLLPALLEYHLRHLVELLEFGSHLLKYSHLFNIINTI